MQSKTFKLRQRTATLKFADDEFAGAEVIARLDVPLSFFFQL